MNAIIVVLLAAVVVSLGHALVSMSSGANRSSSVVRALTVRITLSVALFGFLMVGHYLGWIQPH
jgi:hypothetical protein